MPGSLDAAQRFRSNALTLGYGGYSAIAVVAPTGRDQGAWRRASDTEHPHESADTLQRRGAGNALHINDARVHGFVCAQSRPPTSNAIVTHITNYSHPSPYLSFSTSYAVARQYALSGPGGIASAADPGYVYEVDLAACTGGHSTFNAVIFNPVQELANLGISHEHNGDQALIVGVASGSPHDPVFVTAIPQAGGRMTLPTVTKQLKALVYSLRDAEVLITQVPPACVVIRHDVY